MIAALLAAMLASAPVMAGEGEAIVFTRKPTLCPCPPDGCFQCAEVTVTLPLAGPAHARIVSPLDGSVEERDFVVSAVQAESVRHRLAAYRPAEGSKSFDGAACKALWTDGTYYDIAWQSGAGSQHSLHLYTGCDPERNRVMAEAVGQAWADLPIPH